MQSMTVGEICQAVDGKLIQGSAQAWVNGICTDTRLISPGNLFLTLQGDKFDAHDFIYQAVEGNAGALIVSRNVQASPNTPLIMVQDTRQALQDLAAHYRNHFNLPVVGVTGSSGKTTTKDMIASVLGANPPVLKTTGNYNNEIGLPLTILNLSSEHKAAVVEMAMRGLGEINTLSKIAGPTCAVITNIGLAHLERLGTKENIAQAKGEILAHIPTSGFALLPYNCQYAYEQAYRCKGRVLYYGLADSINAYGDIYAVNIRREQKGNCFTACFTACMEDIQQEIQLPLPGEHNIHNALAAFGVGVLLGIDPKQIAANLAAVSFSGMRMDIQEVIADNKSFTMINDAYNANPDSTCAALQSLAELASSNVAGEKRRTIALLGDMLELGAVTKQGHRQVGAATVRRRINKLITIGPLSKETAQGALLAGGVPEGVDICANNAEALIALKSALKPGDLVLVKGSRGMQMEEIIEALLKTEN